jgi:hypothetical protein
MDAIIGVLTKPGATAFILIPDLAYPIAADLVSPSTAC